MIKYFFLFCLLCLIYNLSRVGIMLSDCVGGGFSEILVTKTRLLGIPFIAFTSTISTTFILILLLCIKSFLSWQARPLTFDNIGYEKIVKEIKTILIIGLLLMILSVFHNYNEIQYFGKQLFLIKDKSKLILLRSKEMNWEYQIRNIWEISVLSSSILFSFRLNNKLKVNLYPSILVGIILLLGLSIPFYEQTYQSIKSIIRL